MNLKIKPFSDEINSIYKNHSHFHQGDAGLDLYIIKDAKHGATIEQSNVVNAKLNKFLF